MNQTIGIGYKDQTRLAASLRTLMFEIMFINDDYDYDELVKYNYSELLKIKRMCVAGIPFHAHTKLIGLDSELLDSAVKYYVSLNKSNKLIEELRINYKQKEKYKNLRYAAVVALSTLLAISVYIF